MTGKLRALAAGEHGGVAGLSERVAALSILAAFLSYLTFTRASYSGNDCAGRRFGNARLALRRCRLEAGGGR